MKVGSQENTSKNFFKKIYKNCKKWLTKYKKLYIMFIVLSS